MYKYKTIFLLFLWIFSFLGTEAQNWKQYPYTPEGSIISFPTDEGRHVEEPVEWWYMSGHLTGQESGIPYSFMVSYFYYPAYGFDGFRILNIARDDTGEFFSDAQGLYYTTIGTDSLNIQARLMNDTVEWWTSRTDTLGNAIPFEYEVFASSTQGGLDFLSESSKNPLILGDSGYFNQGASSYTYYYSFTENKINGTIRFGELTEEVSGTAWIDKQYGDFLPSPDQRYEWLSVNLSNGMDFVLWNLFNGQKQSPDQPEYRHISIWEDTATQYTMHEFELERLTFAYMPDNEMCYAQQWHLTCPTNQIDLLITTVNTHEDIKLPFRFYEGATTVTGTVNGVAVTGRGFAELVKSYLPPEPAIMYPQGGTWKDSLRLGWTILNPDDGLRPLYDLDFSIDGGETFNTLEHGLTDTKYTWDEFSDLEAGDSCWFRVIAYTTDTTLSGQTTSQHPSVYEPDTSTVSFHELSASPADFSIYPVPTKDFLIVKRDNPGPFIYHIFDATGKMAAMGEEPGSGSLTNISLEILKPGIYMMVITIEGADPERQPFIKL
ncbi:MAG: T9SS type A sorting domain-containing protein [Bacteroidetes bacterium]|nr:T9SS type A sorting domain-containing protein [Bacteroidota bacterium]